MRQLHVETREVRLNPTDKGRTKVNVVVCDVTGAIINRLRTGDVVRIAKRFDSEQKAAALGKRHKVRIIAEDDDGKTVEVRRLRKVR